jgi:hypothetical protein
MSERTECWVGEYADTVVAKRGVVLGVLGGGETWLTFRSFKTKQLHVRPAGNHFGNHMAPATSSL